MFGLRNREYSPHNEDAEHGELEAGDSDDGQEDTTPTSLLRAFAQRAVPTHLAQQLRDPCSELLDFRRLWT